MEEFGSDGWRRLFTVSSVLASLGIAAYALSYLPVLTSFSPTLSFAPTIARTGIDWFAVSQSIYLLVGTVAFLPVGLMYAIRGFRTKPYAAVLVASLVVTSLILLVVGNLPVIGEQLYPGTFADLPAAELLRSQQIEAATNLAFDAVAFVAFYAALIIYGQMSRHEAPLANRLVTLSLAVFSLAAGFMALSPVASMLLVEAAVISVVPIPILLALIVERRTVLERQGAAGRQPVEPTANRPGDAAGPQLVGATE